MHMFTLEDFLVGCVMFSVFSFVGLIFDAWLVRTGRIPYSKKIVMIFFSLLLAFMKPFVLRDISWWLYSIIYFAIIMTLNRSDWGESIKSGKWWWKKEKSERITSIRQKTRK